MVDLSKAISHTMSRSGNSFPDEFLVITAIIAVSPLSQQYASFEEVVMMAALTAAVNVFNV